MASFHIRRLCPMDGATLRNLNTLFAEAFEDPESYGGAPPSDTYVANLLAKEHVVVLVALSGEDVVGGLVAYELEKFERARSEFYIYDLAVAESHRRKNIATGLINTLREIATRRGGWVVYVQADYGDEPAIALYETLGSREDVMHFDIAVEPPRASR